MNRILLIASATILGTSLAGCQSGSIATFTKHLNERDCATKGNVTGSAGILGTAIGGHVEWDCGKGQPAANPDT